jgi:hypothetical protein
MADEPKDHGAIMSAYKMVAATPEGQMMVMDLVSKFAFTRQSMAPIYSSAPLDPLRLAFHEGQRTVLVHIGRMIEGNPTEAKQTRKRKTDDESAV